jgi:hypothetical protein
MKRKYSTIAATAGLTFLLIALSSNIALTSSKAEVVSATLAASPNELSGWALFNGTYLRPTQSPNAQEPTRSPTPSPNEQERGLVRATPRTQPVPDSLGSNWDFEEGLDGWTPTGEAFANQPTLGDNVVAARVRADMTLERGGIGGDYWKRVPYPIGHHLDAWVGTYENHPAVASSLGAVGGDGGTGTLTSGDFPLDEAHRFVAFMVGGGSDVATERVELQVRGENAADVVELERLVGANLQGIAALAVLWGGSAAGDIAVPARDGNYVIVRRASGQNSEVMRQIVFEVPQTLRGRRARLRIIDNSGGSWAHINVDDFRFGASRPPDRPQRVWGFADTHTHPVNDLAFGGNVVQGSLYARDGSPFSSDSYRRTAIPHMFENINLSQFGPVEGLIVGNAVLGATRAQRSGYPEMQGYPAFNQMLGQQMYGEWIRRAYDGGLRLMSALAVNNWLASSHPLKKQLLGTSQPEDDKGSGDVQVADVKAWAARPENSTWVEVAYTPAEARRIISENKLAVVLGLELDVLGNFIPNGHFSKPGVTVVMPDDNHPAEQRALIAAELDRLYAQGVRQVGPFHYVSGVWGGCAMFQRLFNEVNRKITNDNVHVVEGPEGIRYRLDMDAWGLTGVESRRLVSGEAQQERQSDPSWESTRGGHVNAMGLSQAGEILFDELARRGMLIDLDHASYRSTNRLLQLARERDYPVLSSHSDYLELGFSGPGEFTHNLIDNNHGANFDLFNTTLLDPLRNEGMVTRTKLETIAQLGGTTGAIMWLPRRKSWGNAVPNDCDGSSKTWAQGYQYAVEVTGGRGVALSTDRITLEPRFGPNAAYLLGLEDNSMPLRDERRFEQVDAQGNGVRYDSPIKEWRAYRFTPAAVSAWQKTPIPGGWESRPWEHGDAWKAIAAWATGHNPRTMRDTHGVELSGDPLHLLRVINFAWGFGSETRADLVSDCGFLWLNCGGAKLDERYAAYCVKKGITPAGIEPWPDHRGVWENYRWVKRAWDEWQRMSGSNEPLRRHFFGERDFDVNLDGVAHYGMLPDFLQDVANSHPRPAEVGTYLDPLFRSAESYISMWEKARRAAGLRDSDP